jgi:hypothetical protein
MGAADDWGNKDSLPGGARRFPLFSFSRVTDSKMNALRAD